MPSLPDLSAERGGFDNVFERIKDEEEFCRFVGTFFAAMSKVANLKPEFSPLFAHEAWEAYCGDVDRMQISMPNGKQPDHFKRCGCLAYWLRRNSPVIRWHEDPPSIARESPLKEWRTLFEKCGNAFLAFALGYHICHYYEAQKGNAPRRKPDLDYLEDMCYVMKRKNLSPHAMGMVYRSLFL